MGLSFDGITLSGGVTPLYGTNGTGSISSKKCDLVHDAGAGIALDPFSFDIPCDCQPQQGDTIEVTARTILLMDITTVRWNLCGGQCRGSMTEPGFSLGLEIKNLKWKVA